MAWPPEVIEAESPLYEILRIVARRPGMYFGEQPLEYFRAWLEGYKAGLAQAEQTDPVLDAMDRKNMDEFFGEYLDLPMKHSGESAFKMVAYVSPSQGLNAFLDFLCIFDRYLETTGYTVPSPSISDEIHRNRLGNS